MTSIATRVSKRTNSFPSGERVAGVAAALGTAAVALAIREAVPQVSPLVIAVIVGMAIGNGSERLDSLTPGLSFAARTLLRAGVVLLGLRLSLSAVWSLGPATLVVVVVTVVATFFGTQALGRRLGLSQPLSLLIATGYSICGASAIAAMESTAEVEEEEVAAAIGLVTLAGTVAMFALPTMTGMLGLSDVQFGTWVGASVHDVAQVVAAASTGSAVVVQVAIVVKLTRVVLLAPLVTGVNVAAARSVEGERPPLLPGFVVAFLGLMLIRSVGVVPTAVLEPAGTLSTFLLTAALVGMGAGVRWRRLRTLGRAPLILGALAWVVVAGVSLAATLVLA